MDKPPGTRKRSVSRGTQIILALLERRELESQFIKKVDKPRFVRPSVRILPLPGATSRLHES